MSEKERVSFIRELRETFTERDSGRHVMIADAVWDSVIENFDVM